MDEAWSKDINRTISEGIRKGNHSAFEILYKTYFEPLFHFAKDYVVDTEPARNIIQDSFLSIWEKREFLDVSLNLKSYLYTIVRNKSLNYLKQEQNRKRINTDIQNEYFEEVRLNYEALRQFSVEQIDFDELQKHIELMTENLPAQCRQIFKLSRFEGMKNAEIAAHLGISVKTVEWHITQAIKSFREGLKKMYSSDILSQIIFFL